MFNQKRRFIKRLSIFPCKGNYSKAGFLIELLYVEVKKVLEEWRENAINFLTNIFQCKQIWRTLPKLQNSAVFTKKLSFKTFVTSTSMRNSVGKRTSDFFFEIMKYMFLNRFFCLQIPIFRYFSWNL